MCFSATASFTASAALGIIGAATLSHAKERRELPLAVIPLIFALQQAIEGILWLTIGGRMTEDTMVMTYLFLFFAFFWWPAYMPLVAYALEDDPPRKKIMLGLLGLGLVVGITIYGSFLINPEPAKIVNRCVYYNYNSPLPGVMLLLYTFTALGAGIFSSKRIMNIFSLILSAFALIAGYFYAVNFSSVWCFYAAVLSAMLYLHFAGKKIRLPTVLKK